MEGLLEQAHLALHSHPSDGTLRDPLQRTPVASHDFPGVSTGRYTPVLARNRTREINPVLSPPSATRRSDPAEPMRVPHGGGLRPPLAATAFQCDLLHADPALRVTTVEHHGGAFRPAISKSHWNA